MGREFSAGKDGAAAEKPKPVWHHEWEMNGAACSGVKEVMVPLRGGEAPYSVRCDDRSHLHPVLVCTAPDGRTRRFEFFKQDGWRLDPMHQDHGSPGYGHKHPWQAPRAEGEIFLGHSHLWPEGEFRRERIPVLQARHGRPLQPRPPEPPPVTQPPWFMQAAAGISIPAALAAPPRAERGPLRTWTRPDDEKPATAPVDDGWGDGEDIPF